jgi:hypothetical protein
MMHVHLDHDCCMETLTCAARAAEALMEDIEW